MTVKTLMRLSEAEGSHGQNAPLNSHAGEAGRQGATLPLPSTSQLKERQGGGERGMVSERKMKPVERRVKFYSHLGGQS